MSTTRRKIAEPKQSDVRLASLMSTKGLPIAEIIQDAKIIQEIIKDARSFRALIWMRDHSGYWQRSKIGVLSIRSATFVLMRTRRAELVLLMKTRGTRRREQTELVSLSLVPLPFKQQRDGFFKLQRDGFFSIPALPSFSDRDGFLQKHPTCEAQMSVQDCA